MSESSSGEQFGRRKEKAIGALLSQPTLKQAAAAETEKDHRIRQLERTLGRKALEIEILKNVVGE